MHNCCHQPHPGKSLPFGVIAHAAAVPYQDTFLLVGGYTDGDLVNLTDRVYKYVPSIDGWELLPTRLRVVIQFYFAPLMVEFFYAKSIFIFAPTAMQVICLLQLTHAIIGPIKQHLRGNVHMTSALKREGVTPKEE